MLIDFLNGLLPEHHKIKDLTYSRNEHLGDLSIDRRAVFDIYCQSLNGDRFIVELQKAKQNFFKDRSVETIQEHFSPCIFYLPGFTSFPAFSIAHL